MPMALPMGELARQRLRGLFLVVFLLLILLCSTAVHHSIRQFRVTQHIRNEFLRAIAHHASRSLGQHLLSGV